MNSCLNTTHWRRPVAKKICTCQQTPADSEKRWIGDPCLCEVKAVTVHYLARDAVIAHEIEANIAQAMHYGSRVKVDCLRCGETLKPPGSWRSGPMLWDGVKLCEKAKEAQSDE